MRFCHTIISFNVVFWQSVLVLLPPLVRCPVLLILFMFRRSEASLQKRRFEILWAKYLESDGPMGMCVPLGLIFEIPRHAAFHGQGKEGLGPRGSWPLFSGGHIVPRLVASQWRGEGGPRSQGPWPILSNILSKGHIASHGEVKGVQDPVAHSLLWQSKRGPSPRGLRPLSSKGHVVPRLVASHGEVTGARALRPLLEKKGRVVPRLSWRRRGYENPRPLASSGEEGGSRP